MVKELFEKMFGSVELAEPALAIAPSAEDASSNQTVGVTAKQIEIGSSGTRVHAGYPAEEYLQALQGMRRADVFDQIRRSDPQVIMCLMAVKNPIKSATWEVEAGAAPGEMPTPEAEADAQLIRHILFDDLDQPWDKFLSEALTFIEFGHSVFEVTHKVVINHKRFGSYNGLQSLSWRSPRTIDRWNVNPKTGKLKSIHQVAEGDLGRSVELLDTFLLTFSINKEGSNYEGISMLRPCYGCWKRKDLYLKLNAIGIEKYAVPSPIAKIPEGKENTPQADNLLAVLENYTSHESNFLIVPHGWEINLHSNDFDPSKVESSVDAEDKRMAKAFLANFLELGMNGTGAFALSNDLSDFMLTGLEHIAREICAPINMDLIPQLIKMNKGAREFYPRIKFSGISDKAGNELATMLTALSNGKWLTPEDGDEDHLRRRMGLPARTREGIRETAPAGGGFGKFSLTAAEEALRDSKNLTLSERIFLVGQIREAKQRAQK